LESRVLYKVKAEKDLKKISEPMRTHIMDKITMNLSRIPPEGKPLTGEFKGYYSYRVGDYRALYVKIPEGALVLRIGHRREVYK